MANFITVGCKLPHGIIIEHNGKKATLLGQNSSIVIGGYGISQVEKEFFEAWAAANKDFAPLKKGLIFAHEKTASVEAQAKEQAEVKSGLEGLNPDKPLPKIEKADAEVA